MLLCRFWETEPGPLKEQQKLLNAGPPLYTLSVFIIIIDHLSLFRCTFSEEEAESQMSYATCPRHYSYCMAQPRLTFPSLKYDYYEDKWLQQFNGDDHRGKNFRNAKYNTMASPQTRILTVDRVERSELAQQV